MSMQQQDISALTSRITSIEFHVDNVEKEIERLRLLLQNYVPVRENDLKIQSIQDIVKRIESDVIGAKQQLTELNTKIVTQEAKQRESQDNLQIRVLYGVVAFIITVAAGVLIVYFTHGIH